LAVTLIHLFLISSVNIELENNITIADKKKSDKSTTEELTEEELKMTPLERLMRQRKRYGIHYLGEVEVRYKSKLSKLFDSNDFKKIDFDQLSKISTNLKASNNNHKTVFNDYKRLELTENEKKKIAFSLLKNGKKEYKKCYRKFQNQDQLLEGFVELRVNPNVNSKVKFSGIGQKSIVNNLESCIRMKVSRLNFPLELNGSTYKLKVLL
jgi:hypothetical protein